VIEITICGWCGKGDLEKVPFDPNTGQGLETHRVPGPVARACKGPDTVRPEAPRDAEYD
jgi:hypothetical protein